jgi:hemerythrin-like metal-binding protein
MKGEAPMEKNLIQWSDALGAGIIWMDYQHQTLIEKINFLYTAILEKKGEELIAETLAFLDDYIANHFALEEKYMEACSYPERPEHVKEHNQFRKNVQDLKTLTTTKGELVAESLCYDLFEWFRSHIRTTDKKLGIFLKAQSAL